MNNYAIFIIKLENGLKTTLPFITITPGTIYHPAKYIIMTGLLKLQLAKKISPIINSGGVGTYLNLEYMAISL